eukprot:2561533-Heterocapsa_arctica.AAC.1
MTRNPHTPPGRLFVHEPVGETGATISGAILDLPLRGSRPKMLQYLSRPELSTYFVRMSEELSTPGMWCRPNLPSRSA